VSERIVFLFDVDNTLLDNDRVESDLRAQLDAVLGESKGGASRDLFHASGDQLGYADYVGTLERYSEEAPEDTRVFPLATGLIDYPFEERFYPGARDVVARLAGVGTTVILCDGDVVLQPRKIARSGLGELFGGRVLIYAHKQKHLDAVARAFPADHYVVIDDKPEVLADIKRAWKSRVTTVFPRQGHFAFDPAQLAHRPRPDVTLERIDELLRADVAQLVAAGRTSTAED